MANAASQTSYRNIEKLNNNILQNETPKLYNSFFHTNFSNIKIVEADNIKRVKQFFNQMLYCKPGTFQYMSLLADQVLLYPVIITQNIKGLDSNHTNCMLEASYTSHMTTASNENLILNHLDKCTILINDLLFYKLDPTPAFSFALAPQDIETMPVWLPLTATCTFYQNGKISGGGRLNL